MQWSSRFVMLHVSRRIVQLIKITPTFGGGAENLENRFLKPEKSLRSYSIDTYDKEVSYSDIFKILDVVSH